MKATEFWSLYCEKWNRKDTERHMKLNEETLGEWTKAMTILLHEIGKNAGHHFVVVDMSITKEEQKRWGLGDRKEYLKLDGMWLPSKFGGRDEGEWCLPRVVIEHQSYDTRYRDGPQELFALCLWKLLCVRAKLRVLIAYMPPKMYQETKEKLKGDVLDKMLEDDGNSQVLMIFEDSSNAMDGKTPAWWYSHKPGQEVEEHSLEWERE